MIALSLLVLALVLIAAEAARHHHPTELGFLVALAAGAGLSLRWLLRDLRRHPVNFPAASASQGLRFAGGTNDR